MESETHVGNRPDGPISATERFSFCFLGTLALEERGVLSVRSIIRGASQVNVLKLHRKKVCTTSEQTDEKGNSTAVSLDRLQNIHRHRT